MVNEILLYLLIGIIALGALYGACLLAYSFFVYRPGTRALKNKGNAGNNGKHVFVPPFTTATTPTQALRNQNVCATILFALASEGRKVTDLPDEASIPYKNARL